MNKLILAAACVAACGAAQAQSATYAIDPTHTYAGFEVLHVGTSTLRVRFDKKDGTVQFDRAGKTGRAEITLDIDSIDSGVPAFDKHLKSKDFFNTAEYPTARFVGDRFEFAGDKVSAVSGTLTLLGKANPVTLKATQFNCYMNPMFKREVCGGDFETVIQRSQWGVSYGLPAYAPDNVRLVIQIEAIKQ
jgi:polyisoprenoid-binding protein YceI